MNKLNSSLGFLKKVFLFATVVATFVIINESHTNNMKLWTISKDNYFVLFNAIKDGLNQSIVSNESTSFIILNILSNKNANKLILSDLPLQIPSNFSLNTSLDCPLIPNNLSIRHFIILI